MRLLWKQRLNEASENLLQARTPRSSDMLLGFHQFSNDYRRSYSTITSFRSIAALVIQSPVPWSPIFVFQHAARVFAVSITQHEGDAGALLFSLKTKIVSRKITIKSLLKP